MKTILLLAIKSLKNRRSSVLLTVLTIAVSVALLIGVEKIRTGVRTGFTQTVSGTDLLVGARTGSVQLLLSTVFHIGNPSNNLSWEHYQKIADHPDVDWTIPISLGDSHAGYRVVGTDEQFFQYYRYADKRLLTFQSGQAFQTGEQAVIGIEIARALGYELGDSIVIAHGAGNVSFVNHDQHPVEIVGILAATGTPIDRVVLVELHALEAVHAEFGGGFAAPSKSQPSGFHRESDDHPESGHDESSASKHHGSDGESDGHSESDHDETSEPHHHGSHSEVDGHSESGHGEASEPEHHGSHAESDDHSESHHTETSESEHHALHGESDHHAEPHHHETSEPEQISAFLVGLKSRIATLRLQRLINEYPEEPLTAVLPGVALQELWRLFSVAEIALLVVSACVVAAGLLGMAAMILSTLRERRREMAILRSVGARAWQILLLLMSEAWLLASAGAMIGMLTAYGLLSLMQPWLTASFGLNIALSSPTAIEWLIVAAVSFSAVLVAVWPALIAYRQSLADGLTVRL